MPILQAHKEGYLRTARKLGLNPPFLNPCARMLCNLSGLLKLPLYDYETCTYVFDMRIEKNQLELRVRGESNWYPALTEKVTFTRGIHQVNVVMASRTAALLF